MSEPSEPRVVDRPWRIWPSVAVIAIVLSGALLGVLIIPVVQGRGAGIDPYTAICRALGILPGSPARPRSGLASARICSTRGVHTTWETGVGGLRSTIRGTAGDPGKMPRARQIAV